MDRAARRQRHPSCLVGAVLALAAGVVTAPAADAQQMYRWTDKEGRIHYSDKAPMETPKSIEQRRIGGSVVEQPRLSFATARAAQSAPVTLYTAQNCKEICQRARELLAQRGVPFSEVAVADEKSLAKLKEISGDGQVPVLTVGSEVTKGFEPGSFNTALDAGGYPKSAAPLKPAAQAPAPAPRPEAPSAPPAPRGRYTPN